MNRATAQMTRTDWLCDRCGEVVLPDVRCCCQQPHDPISARRRHREAVIRARRTDAAVRPRQVA